LGVIEQKPRPLIQTALTSRDEQPANDTSILDQSMIR
jgi:hypothetical protein